LIVYKVIQSKDRKSATNIGRYRLHYPKGKIVKAKSWTIGIMCFTKKSEAKDFCSPVSDRKIIKVKSIGKGKKPKRIIFFTALRDVLKKNYTEELKNSFQKPYHKSTICYPAVEVLE
jgi:hypothetical protein